MPTLYTTALSANGRKPLAVARHLSLDVDVEWVDVYRGEGSSATYRALNPWGKVPTLVDGDLVLWESNAILVYLSEAYADWALLRVLDSVLERDRFVCGAAVSLADFSIGGMTTYFRATQFPETEYPAIAAWLRRMDELHAWRATEVEPWQTAPTL